MVGRSDKGLLITAGTFTPDAKREATATAQRQLTSSTGTSFVIC
jgi:hypothetical protein